ncbi:MAG: TonB-dependent receptor [Bacteroidetes bacterium]|nr:TonB-dependent receptor [Bacteroidota bacterium]
MRLLLFFSLSIAFCTSISAQTIQGKIVDIDKGEPVIGATVVLEGTTIGTTTDLQGAFTIQVSDGSNKIRIKSIGFQEIVDMVMVGKGETKTRDYKMESSVVSKEVVVVTGGKYKKKFEEEIVSMEVLKSNVVQNNNGRITEALTKIPGFTLVGETPSIRGGSGYTQGSASRLLVLLDDMPALSPENASVKWEMLPTDNLEQIELIKGASSCLYGSSALNGVMNFRTANAKSKPQSTVTAGYGIYDRPSNPNYAQFWKIRTPNLDTTYRSPHFTSFSFSDLRKLGQFDLSEGFNYRFDEGYLQSDEKVRIRNNFKLKYRPKNMDRLTISLNNNFLYEKGFYFFLWKLFPDIAKDDLYTTNQLNPTKTLYFNIDPVVNFIDKKGNTHVFKNRYMYGHYVADGQDNQTHNTYHEYSFNTKIEKLDMNIITGAAASFVWTDGLAIKSKSSMNISEYIQADMKLFKKLTVSAGLRLEYFKVDSIQTSYEIPFTNIKAPLRPVLKFGANYQISKGMFLRGSWGQGYRFPTLSELYYSATSYGFPIFPNDTLRPESGWNAELGYKMAYKIGDFVGYFDVAGFYTRYNDMTDFYIGSAAGPKGEYGVKTLNVDRAEIYGFEVSSLGQGKVKKLEMNYLVGLTYVEPRNMSHNPNDTIQNPDPGDTVNLFVANVPKYLKYRSKVSIKADIEFKYNKLLFGFSVQYNSHIVEVDRDIRVLVYGTEAYRRMHANGYIVVDSRFGYQFTKNLQLMINCKNIFNEEYTIRPAKIEAPRNFTFTVLARF